VLNADLTPASWTASFRAWVAELPPSGPDPRALPPAVYEIAGRVQAGATGGALPNRLRLRSRAGRWSVIEGAALEGGDAGQVAITVRAATGEEICDLLARAYGLTRRERQLVALVRQGLSTEQIARALCISPYTVKDHLKAIFDKTGVQSRPELVSHLAGRNAASGPPPPA
jgi:DNA-binding CsgD family transcriptional regulator